VAAAGALGPGAEFDLIRTLLQGARGHPRLRVGPGDDAAVLDAASEAGGDWVWTCDVSVEDVHFRRAWLAPYDIGQRSVRAALSDIAAMAGEPVAVLVSLGGTRADHADGTLAAVGRGARDAVEELGAALAGGDVTRSPGPLLVDVTALGVARRPVLRSGGRAGDGVWVTGCLGGAAAAVRLLEEGRPLSVALRTRLARPRPRIAEARALADSGHLHALLDLSDGLAGDAGHLAAASDLAVVLEHGRIPVDPDAIDALGREQATGAALEGGEDYELLFAADPAFEAEAPGLARRLGVSLVRVGRCQPGQGVRLEHSDGRLEAPGRAWDHFA
jgi:thiamine-monophosphate kinase